MAVAFVSASQGGASNAASLTIAHTVSAGADTALLVIVQSIAADRLSGGSVTWRGNSMGSPILTFWNGAGAATYAWLIVAPEVGSGNVVITFNNATSFGNAVVYSFTGVDQTTPVATTATFGNGFATSPRSLPITTPADGACVDMLYVSGNRTITPVGSGQTAAGVTMVNSGSWTLRGSYLIGAGSVMDWTFTGGTLSVIQGAVALNPASTAAVIDLGSGSYSISGQAVSTLAFRKTDLNPGAYSWGGQDVSLTYEQPGVYVLSLASGSYLFEGSDALRVLGLNLDFGSYSINGQELGFTRTFPQTYSISLETGNYNWSGRNIRLFWSGEPITTTKQTSLSVSIRMGL